MKKIYCIFLLFLAVATVNFGQPRAKIVTEGVSPRTVTQYGTNSMSAGLHVVAKGTYSYLSPLNIGDEEAITSVNWTMNSKPAGSNATLTNLTNNWVCFKADTNGTYNIGLHMVTAGGSHDTTINIVASYYVGVGNFSGVPATWPQCMSCHASMPAFAAIFDKWKVSMHATKFQRDLTDPLGHVGNSCLPCHTVGTDNKVVADNNGFDDIARQLGWKLYGPNPGKWDSLVTYYPTLVNHATIGCENCHGAGKEHGSTADVSKIEISLSPSVCNQCHDAPWRHHYGTEYTNSVHSVALWESGFAQGTSSQNNSLGNCIRCHDGQGFINFTKGVTTNTTGWNLGKHNVISCQTCHDPHNGERRVEPAIADTLANGYNYGTIGGEGHICMNCHKARKNGVTLVNTSLSAHWGPHGSVQSDNFLAQNFITFNNTPYPSGTHRFALANLCVDCHMQTTTDTGTVTRDKVGGHSWNMSYGDYDHTVKCQSCHGPQIVHFDDFIAAADYDGNGVIESIQAEVKGMIHNTKMALPHIGEGDTVVVDWQSPDFNLPNGLTRRQVWFNMQMVENDGSFGMHNAKLAIAVLQRGYAILTGIVPVELTSFNASLSGNNAIVTWETSTETNNKGFDVERKTGKDFVKVAFVNGKGTTTNSSVYSYTDKLNNVASGKVVYRIKQIDFSGKTTYSKEVTVNYEGPKNYSLSQNYPNPFNPSTTIKFVLPYDSNVKLNVYNVAGQLVKTLVNGVQTAGNHDVNFNLQNLSSGIYFYSLEASATDGSASFRETKKMVLMK